MAVSDARPLALAVSQKAGKDHRDNKLLAAALDAQGVPVEFPVWDDDAADWTRYRGVFVRTVWDYHQKMDRFLAWLDTLDQQGVAVVNPTKTLRWNMDKRYLIELQQAGVPIVPTHFFDAPDAAELEPAFAAFDATQLVVKPTVDATAEGLWVATQGAAHANADRLASMPAERGVMVQPFLDSVVENGEWALHHFGGRFSHAVLKRSGAGDFRVQEEHGGSVHAIEAPAGIRAAAQRVLDACPVPWTYARVDGVVDGDRFLLMELELLEPQLYLDSVPGSADQCARAIAASV